MMTLKLVDPIKGWHVWGLRPDGGVHAVHSAALRSGYAGASDLASWSPQQLRRNLDNGIVVFLNFQRVS